MNERLDFTGTLLEGAHVRAEVGPEHIPLAVKITQAHAADQYRIPDRDNVSEVSALIVEWDLANADGPIAISPQALAGAVPVRVAVAVSLAWALATLATLEVRPTRINLN